MPDILYVCYQQAVESFTCRSYHFLLLGILIYTVALINFSPSVMQNVLMSPLMHHILVYNLCVCYWQADLLISCRYNLFNQHGS
jgi:hypothetical protein